MSDSDSPVPPRRKRRRRGARTVKPTTPTPTNSPRGVSSSLEAVDSITKAVRLKPYKIRMLMDRFKDEGIPDTLEEMFDFLTGMDFSTTDSPVILQKTYGKGSVLYGDTRKYKDILKDCNINLRFNPNLRVGPGWVFGRKRFEDVRTLLEDNDIPYVEEE